MIVINYDYDYHYIVIDTLHDIIIISSSYYYRIAITYYYYHHYHYYHSVRRPSRVSAQARRVGGAFRCYIQYYELVCTL